jgi:hypothetical protein
MESPQPVFVGYPAAQEVKDVKYETHEPSNPVFSGLTLSIGAYMYVFWQPFCIHIDIILQYIMHELPPKALME